MTGLLSFLLGCEAQQLLHLCHVAERGLASGKETGVVGGLI